MTSEQERYLNRCIPHDLDIYPENMREQYEAVETELRSASEELNRANQRYHAAIMARLALDRERQISENQKDWPRRSVETLGLASRDDIFSIHAIDK